MSRAAAGELTEVRVKGRNEIATLAASFNQLSSEVAQRQQHVTHVMHHDEASGLPNMRAVEQRLGEMRRLHDPSGVFAGIIAIDRASQLRLAIGHARWSALVGEIAKRIAFAYGELFVGRADGDAIAFVFRAESHEAAMHTISAVATLASQPVWLGEDRIEVRIVAGLACDGDDADTRLPLLARAEAAVDLARATRQPIMAFDRESYGDPTSAMAFMEEMLLGLSRGELYLAYQPRLDLRKGVITSAEALLRWRHPQRGMVAPDKFVRMAEETGHIRPLTDWVIDRAIADQRRMREAGRDMVLSVNISGRLIADEAFANRALRQIRRTGARLCFEITEAAVVDNPDLALDLMKDIRDAGIGIVIDDYGSNLSSLACLRAIPAQELKIDRPMIQSMARGNSDALLVRSLIDLAHSLGMTAAAEGVETSETLGLLQSMGCDAAQGFFIGHPLPLDEFLKFEVDPGVIARPQTALKGLG